MFQLPVNRWTLGAVAAILVIFGQDFILPLMKVIGVLSAPYVPAA